MWRLGISHMTPTSHKTCPVTPPPGALQHCRFWVLFVFFACTWLCQLCIGWLEIGGGATQLSGLSWLADSSLQSIFWIFNTLVFPVVFLLFPSTPPAEVNAQVTWSHDLLMSLALQRLAAAPPIVTVCFYFEGDEDKNSYRKIIKIIQT